MYTNEFKIINKLKKVIHKYEELKLNIKLYNCTGTLRNIHKQLSNLRKFNTVHWWAVTRYLAKLMFYVHLSRYITWVPSKVTPKCRKSGFKDTTASHCFIGTVTRWRIYLISSPFWILEGRGKSSCRLLN